MSNQNGTNMVNDNADADDPLVQIFYGVGPSFVLIGFATFKMVFAIISQLFCASLLYVTAKTSSLRETYNWLIAANSLASLLFSFTFFIQFWIAVLGINLIPLRLCFPLMAVPIFFAQCQYLLFLALAIDRLIIAFFPIWHLKNIQNSVSASIAYLAVIFGAISIYSAYCVFTGINYSFVEKPEKLVTCSTPDAVPSFVFQIPLYFNLFSLSQYLFLCYIMAIKKSSAANFKATRKMLKAIVVAFLVEFSGWFGNTLTRNICIWLELTQMQQWYTMNFAGLILVPVLAFYVPMLYILSSDYSRAFHRCFGLKFPFSSLASSPSIADEIIVSVPINAKKVRSADEAWRNY